MGNGDLSISDWISSLSSEKHSNTSNIIGFGSFMLAAGIAIFAVRINVSNSWPTIIVSAVAGLALLIVYFKAISPLRHRTKVAGELLDKIMKGEERDVLKIEVEWKKVLVGKTKKSKEK